MAGDTTEYTDRRDSDNERPAASSDRVLTERPLDQPLPSALRDQLGRLLGDSSVETLGDWVDEVRAHTGGGSIDLEDLCHADDETPHYGVAPDDTYHFQCCFDAVLLTALLDDPVDVHTVSPDGTDVELTAVETDAMTVRPESAVFSFGVSASVDVPPDRDPTHQDVYAAICPFVRAFPDTAAYHEWAVEAPAETVAMPMADARPVAAVFVD